MTTPNPYKQVMDELLENPIKLKAFMRSIMGPPSRTLEGQEKENVWLMIQLLDNPSSATNNQRTITEVYHLNQKEYTELG